MNDLGYRRLLDPWTRPRAIVTVLALPAVTAALLVLFYHGRFPWVRSSLLMTLVTCIAGVAGAGRQLRGGVLQSPLMYALVVVPVVFILIYPGTRALGLFSDRSAYWAVVALAAVHGIGFSQVRRAVEEAESANETD